MTRTLTIVSLAGIMVLALMPFLFLRRIYTGDMNMDSNDLLILPERAFLVSLIVLGVSVSGAMALIVIRLFDRYFRG